MENIIIVAILVILVGTAMFYIRKEKKKGKKCIGCPCSGTASCVNKLIRKLKGLGVAIIVCTLIIAVGSIV